MEEQLAQFRSGVEAVQGPQNFQELIGIFIDIINLLLPVVAGLALLVFFKGLVAFIAKAGDAKSHAEGRSLMIWGVVAIFVMVSIFGILRMFYADLGFSRPFGLPLLPPYSK